MMAKDEDLQKLAEAVKELFQEKCEEFRSEDFVQVAGLLGFHAFEKAGSGETLKPVAENYLPDIISTNLQYSVEAYEWKTHVPMTEDGVIVSGFWDTRKGQALPEGYVMDEEGKFLRRKG